jgi:hypothetical protein
MAEDDESARRARADRLRKQIGEKTAPGKPAEGPRPGESPRDFVERRQRELDTPPGKR